MDEWFGWITGLGSIRIRVRMISFSFFHFISFRFFVLWVVWRSSWSNNTSTYAGL